MLLATRPTRCSRPSLLLIRLTSATITVALHFGNKVWEHFVMNVASISRELWEDNVHKYIRRHFKAIDVNYLNKLNSQYGCDTFCTAPAEVATRLAQLPKSFPTFIPVNEVFDIEEGFHEAC